MGKRNKILIGFLIGLALGFAGFFVWQGLAGPENNGNDENNEPPRLFSQEDYQIVEEQGEKYIVVEKVGLKAKVPFGWTIEIEGDDYPEPEYWVNLSSPDAEVGAGGILRKGCGISIMVGNAQEAAEENINFIRLLRENPEESDKLKEGYKLERAIINTKEALKWWRLVEPQYEQFGQSLGVYIPIVNGTLVSFETRVPPDYKEICQPIWEEFIENIEIE